MAKKDRLFHTEGLFKQLNILTLKRLYVTKALTYMRTRSPEFGVPVRGIYPTQLSQQQNILVPIHRLAYTERTLRFRLVVM